MRYKKTFGSCLYCGKNIRTYPSRRSKFCSHSHYLSYVELAKTRLKYQNEIFGVSRREKQLIAAP